MEHGLPRRGEHRYQLLPTSVSCGPRPAGSSCRPRAAAALLAAVLLVLCGRQLAERRPASAAAELRLDDTLGLAQKDQDVTCLRGSSVYEPLDMLGQLMSYERAASACQERCRGVSDCTGFSYYQLDGSCHLADRRSVLRVGRVGVSSAPRSCQESSLLGSMKAGGFYVTGGAAALTPWPRTPACAPPSARAGGTRCCSNAGDSCKSICESALAGPTEVADRYVAHDDAAGLCAKQGMRLCTTSELETNICLGTGCWLDGADVWTSSPCEAAGGQVADSMVPSRSGTAERSSSGTAERSSSGTAERSSSGRSSGGGDGNDPPSTQPVATTTQAAASSTVVAEGALSGSTAAPGAVVRVGTTSASSTTTPLQEPASTTAAVAVAPNASRSAAPQHKAPERHKADRDADADVASCKRFGCGDYVPGRACQCNVNCASHESCCEDYEEVCGPRDETEPVAKPSVTYGRWVVAPPQFAGSDCRTVCSSVVGAPCLETAWPRGRDSFDRLRQDLSALRCSTVSEGDGAGYHPSADGMACSWRGSSPGTARCTEKAPPLVSRICPCFGTFELALDERFEGDDLDRSLWKVDVDCWGGGNQEKQCYRDHPENLKVEDGKLFLRAVRGDYHGQVRGCTEDMDERCTRWQPFTSARIHSIGSAHGAWRYGRVEVRAKMPSGNFLWPAIWMLPVEEAYGGWAASGEVDIVECRGNMPRTAIGSLHFWEEWPNDRSTVGNVTFDTSGDLSKGFHNYALEWTADLITQRPLEMRWSVDDYEFFVQDLQGRTFLPSPLGELYPPGTPWDQHFYLILNLAVGGNFFLHHGLGEMRTAADFDMASETWKSSELVVEHVRVWTQPGFEGHAFV